MKKVKLVKTIATFNANRNIYTVGGYTVFEDEYRFEDGGVRKDFTIRETNFGEARYFVDIYYHREKWNDEQGVFQIQTTAYGTLDMDEFAKFIKAQQEALKVAEALTNTFLK